MRAGLSEAPVDLLNAVAERFSASTAAPEEFYAAHAGRLADACLEMARRFHRGGRLLAFGVGSCATDALHIAVEFVHPVIAGKRALPAVALTSDSASLTAIGQADGIEAIFVRQLEALAEPSDMALGLSWDGECEAVLRAFALARRRGLLTIGLAGQSGGRLARSPDVDFAFVAPSADPLVIQEVHETTYHILWELVHVFFGHRGLLEASDG